MLRKITRYLSIAILLTAFSTTSLNAQEQKKAKQKKENKQGKTKSTAPGKIQFTAKNSRHPQTGTFEKWKFTKVDIPGGDIEKGTVELEIDLASIKTKNGKLTNHLKSPDFFDASKYTKATLTIKEAKKLGAKVGAYQAKATISIRKASFDFPITFVHDSKSNKVSGEVTVSRGKMTVGKPYNKTNANSVEDSVIVKFSAKLPKN